MQILVVFSVLHLCGVILTYCNNKLENRIRRDVNCEVKLDIVHKINAVRFTYLQKYFSGELVNIVYNDTNSISSYLFLMNSYFFDAITLIVIGFVAVRINIFLAIILVLPFPIIYLINSVLSKKIKKRSIELFKRNDRFMTFTKSLFSNVLDIKSNNGGGKFNQLFSKEIGEIKRQIIYRDELQLNLSMSTRVINFIGRIIYFAVAGILVFNKKFAPSIFITFSSYINRINSSLLSISTMSASLQNSIVSINRVLQVEEQCIDGIADDADKKEIGLLKTGIQLNNVSYEIDGTSILKKINLFIQPQAHILLTGKNGSGKTTLINLIGGLYEPTSGCILFDNLNLQDIKFSSINTIIGIVTDKAVIYPMSIYDNLTLGCKDIIKKENILQLCKEVELYNDLAAFPNGLDTIIDESINLSAGQKKKIQWVRCIAKNPHIVLLDEPLTNLDQTVRYKFEYLFMKYFKDKTVIMVSHEQVTDKLFSLVYSLNKKGILEPVNISL